MSEVPSCSIERTANDVLIRFVGPWRRESAGALVGLREDLGRVADGARRLTFDLSAVGEWDTTLPLAVTQAVEFGLGLGLKPDLAALPAGVGRLVALSRAVPEQTRLGEHDDVGWVGQLGLAAMSLGRAAQEFVRFLGEATMSLGRFLVGRAKFRWRDLWLLVESCGFHALAIVGLLSFLVGLILAFVAAVQLRLFGADIYVADLVGLAVVREMGALVTAIIMAGRSGAAFAAHLGTMRVSEEIDALVTFGFHPVDMLVSPRVVALFVMMPLLTIYADFIGVMGGMLVTWPTLGITFTQYIEETRTVMTFTHVAVGVAKSTVFGLLVALAGCFQGLRCGRDAAAVGEATTKAVVLGIVLIVCADAVFAVVCEAMDW